MQILIKYVNDPKPHVIKDCLSISENVRTQCIMFYGVDYEIGVIKKQLEYFRKVGD